MANLALRERPPWCGLGASIWMQIAAGNAYNFPLYSHSLKSVLRMNQFQLALLGVANDFGENFGIFPGLFVNMLPPWVMLLIGAVFCFFGYGFLWLTLTRTVPYVSFFALLCALCVATNSNAWFTTGVLVTNLRNFPESRGTVTGILKGYGGIGAAVYTEVYSLLLDSSSSHLLMFLALGVPTLVVLPMCFVRPCNPVHGEDPRIERLFWFIQISSIVLGLYTLATTILDDWVPLSDQLAYALVFFMVLLLMVPLTIPLAMTIYPYQDDPNTAEAEPLLEQSSSAGDVGSTAEPIDEPSPSAGTVGTTAEPIDEPSPSAGTVGTTAEPLLAVSEDAVRNERRPRLGENFTLWQAFFNNEFWLLSLAYFVGVGTGVTVLNNLAQIGIAQHMHDTKILLSVFSFWNFLGRLGGGFVSEWFVRSRAYPRTIWMVLTQLVMVILYLAFSFGFGDALLYETSLLGICYGFQFTIMASTASELFGLEHFGTIFNFISLGNPLGAFFFSSLAARLYDQEAERQNSKSVCLGPECFRFTFLVLAGVSAFGVGVSIYLTCRIMDVYKRLYGGGSSRASRLPQTSQEAQTQEEEATETLE